MKWYNKVLKFIPVKIILEYVMTFLAAEAAKTETDIDDAAVGVIKAILKETKVL